MWNQVSRVMDQAAGQMAERVAHFLPGMLVLLALLLVAGLLSVIVRVVVLRTLRSLDFDRRAVRTGFTVLTEWTPSSAPSAILARCAQWTVLLLGILLGLSALDATIPSTLALSIFRYLPNVLGALVIAILGDLSARVLARSVLINAVNLHIHSARLVSASVKWLVLVLTGAMALERLGIGGQILLVAFGLVFGGIVLAASLAVGLGSQEVVRQSWYGRTHTTNVEQDTLDHV